jgi:hypothetical protein|tara:strand:- start:353 stop:637 length:285 start_codon:yes stop_codon:yes gene_type:complete
MNTSLKMIENTINYTKKLWNDLITKNLETKSCGMEREVAIPYLVKTGKWKELEDWQKEHFIDGIKKGKWDKTGNHLKKNNPYDSAKRQKITEKK